MEINCGNWDEPGQKCKIEAYCGLGNKLCCLECKYVNNCKSSCKTDGGSYNPIKKE